MLLLYLTISISIFSLDDCKETDFGSQAQESGSIFIAHPGRLIDSRLKVESQCIQKPANTDYTKVRLLKTGLCWLKDWWATKNIIPIYRQGVMQQMLPIHFSLFQNRMWEMYAPWSQKYLTLKVVSVPYYVPLGKFS